jgi:hypothetical protein
VKNTFFSRKKNFLYFLSFDKKKHSTFLYFLKNCFAQANLTFCFKKCSKWGFIKFFLVMYSDGTAGLNPMAVPAGLNPMSGQSQSSLMEGAGQGEPMEGFEMTQTIPNNGMIKNSNSQNLPMEFSNMQQPGFMSPGYAIEVNI